MTLPGSRRARVALLVLLVLSILCLGIFSWLIAPAGQPMPQTEAALNNSADVRIAREPWLAFEPAVAEIKSGLIFYPGGRVAPEAYAPLAREIAENGSLAVIVPMPFNLAILNPNAASDVIQAYPGIERWVIGGHSLGGVMAARYAYDHPGSIAGLVLLAAYVEGQLDFSERDLAVAAIFGDRDGLVSVSEVENSFRLLPADTRMVMIEGGNHAQFGWYGEQSGDRAARISRREQQDIVFAAVMSVLSRTGETIKSVLD